MKASCVKDMSLCYVIFDKRKKLQLKYESTINIVKALEVQEVLNIYEELWKGNLILLFLCSVKKKLV